MTNRRKSPMRLTRAEALALAAGLGAAGAVGAAGCTLGGFDRPGIPGANAAGRPVEPDAASAPPRGGTLGLDEAAQVAARDAFIRYDPRERAWILGNANFEERLELRPASGGGFGLVRSALFSRNSDVTMDVAALPSAEAEGATQDALGIAIEGQAPRLTPLDQRLERLSDGALYAAVRFHDAGSGAELTHEMRLRPAHPVVEHRSSILYERERPVRLTRLDSADMVVRSAENARWRAATMDNAGNVSFVRLGRDGQHESEVPAQSAARAPVVPLLVLHDAANAEGLFLGLRWSVNYRIAVRAVGDRRVAVEAGVRLLPNPAMDALSTIDLEPGFLLRSGQTILTPWLILGVFEGTMEEGTNVLKGYLTDDRPREPGWASEVMPVAWNSWFAYGTGVDAASMAAEARDARRLGAEVFYVDYGWSRALGDWTPHPLRFPGRTLRQLSDQVHAAGMRFGLWVAFGVADEDSELLDRHPEFRARQPTPARTGIDGSLPLCLTAAKSHLEGELSRIVREYRLDWLKFDQPMVAACLYNGHGHDPSVRGSLHANTQAFYDLVRGLRDEFPELFIESTFDGAGYLDYGMYARSHGAWLDDAAGDPTAPMTQVQQSAYGATLAFPPRFLTLWLARGPVGDGAPGRGVSPRDLAYQGYSTMGGSWGLSLRLGDLDGAQEAMVQELIREYRALREYLPGAHVYRHAPALATAAGAAGMVTSGPMVREWFALQFHQPDADRSAILAVHNEGGADVLRVTPRALAPGQPYRVIRTDGTELAADYGDALTRRGIEIALPPLSGTVALIQPA